MSALITTSAALLLSATTAVTVVRPLVLANGDFEVGSFEGWPGHWGTVAEVTEAAGREGSGAHILLESGGEGGIYQDVRPVSAGERVRAEAWFAAPAGEGPTGTATYTLKLEVMNEDGLQIQTFQRVLANASDAPQAGTWASDFLAADMPADAAMVRYVFLVNARAGEKVGVYLDDLDLAVVEPMCGDRITDAPGELCDQAELSSETVAGACLPDCSGIVRPKASDEGCAGSAATPLALGLGGLFMAIARRRARG